MTEICNAKVDALGLERESIEFPLLDETNCPVPKTDPTKGETEKSKGKNLKEERQRRRGGEPDENRGG